nr:DNA polymerase III subunit gamma and tau [Kocuria sp. JC486]
MYRRYRPETFQDVIGQSHVTDPLMTALRKNKVSHAYLFSGPRGCGKTTSARILARCLNCAEGPTPNPCGTCESCVDLSRDGTGSLDVIEMDAASHGGVDDARQLRERATFAPVRDRYKIFIIDEAHMVTRDGFNALLKIVEEPPEHIKFIFATTEPNKVLPTIRSRTHHYPFRLVPPEPLMDYLQQLCDQESVGVEPGVLAMVVRAGGGSVRDSLSVLDQLMAGTDAEQIGYDLAVSLLGYTHGALLDDVVDAFASGDAATVFRAVDRVIQTGQDPRRFVEDLLERFRDLVIVDAVPESAANILHGMPEDQVARLRNQAQLMGAAELSRAADITNEALTEMTGATSPQLHLELLCARLLLPSAENTTRGAGARIDRLERRLNMGRTGAPTGPLVDVPQAAPAPGSGDRRTTEGPTSGTSAQAPQAASSPGAVAGQEVDEPTRDRSRQTAPDSTPQSSNGAAAEADNSQSRDRQEDVPAAEPHATPAPRVAAHSAQGPSSGGGIDMIRGSWTEVVNALADIHRVSWMTVMRGTPAAFDGSVLQLVFDGAGDRKNFPRFEPNLVAAIQQVLGVSCRVEAVGPGEAGGGTTGPSTPGGRGPAGVPESSGGSDRPNRPEPQGPPRPTGSAAGPDQGQSAPRTQSATDQPSHARDTAPVHDAGPVDSWAVAKIPTGTEGTATDQDEDAERAPDPAPTTDHPAVGAEPAPAAASANRDNVVARPRESSSTTLEEPPTEVGNGSSDGDTQAPANDPYQDIPWPDEPPPEDDVPPEQWRPSPGGRGTRAPARPEPTPHPAPQPTPAHPSSVSTLKTEPTRDPAAPTRKASFRERHAAHFAAAQAESARSASPTADDSQGDEEFVPSDDDLSVENSGLQGRAMIEKILGGRLIEERPHEPRI